MGLVKCLDCGKEFSDRASQCPNCGCPTEFVLENINEHNKISSEDILYEYYILDTKLAVDKELDSYFKLEMQRRDVLVEYVEVVNQYYYGEDSIDSLIETLPEYISEFLDVALDKAISKLLSHGIYEFDKDTFYEKYEEKFNVKEIITPIIDSYLKIMECEEEINAYHDYVRQSHKNQWTGGGFGIKGAIKGRMKAELLNAGTGFLYSYSDIKNRNQDQVQIIKAKKELLNSEDTKNRVVDAFVQVWESLNFATDTELINHGILKDYGFDIEQAHKLMKNINYVDNIDDIYNICSQAFLKYPLYYPIMECIFEAGFDDNGDAEKFAKEYGLYEKYLENIQESIEDKYREEISDLLSMGPIASNDALFEVLIVCTCMHDDGLEVDEYIDRAVNSRVQFDFSEEDYKEVVEYQWDRFFGNEKTREILNIFKENIKQGYDRKKLAEIVKTACVTYKKAHHWINVFTFSTDTNIKKMKRYETYESYAGIPKDAEIYAFIISGEYSNIPSYIMAITDMGLFMTYNDCSENISISWYDFSQSSYGKLVGGLSINGQRIIIYEDAIYDILTLIKQELQTEIGILEKEPKNIEQKEIEEKNRRLSVFAKEVCIEKSMKLHYPVHNFGNKKDIRKMSDYIVIEEGLKLPQEGEIYYLYVLYGLEQVKKGLAIAEQGIYWTWGWLDSLQEHYMSWIDFTDVKLEVYDKDLFYINENEVYTGGVAKYIYDILLEIKNRINNATKTEEKINDKFTEIQSQQDRIKLLCNDFINKHLELKFEISKKIRKGLNIPDDESIYLAHDDTLLQSGKDGYAITNKGFYCKLPYQVVMFLSYEKFQNTKKIFENTCIIFADEHCIAYHSCLGEVKEDLINLYKCIREALELDKQVSCRQENNLARDTQEKIEEIIEKKQNTGTMFCTSCGKQINRTAKFCNYCGTVNNYEK